MNSQLFVPTKIKIGYQNRDDTFSKKLAYVIYFDNKSVLRKERSWESWRDKKIPSEEFDNVPTSGFVLNKKVGGYKSDWNHRQTYCRIWDARGFEFEIDIANLLYILENANCMRGKGLEGDFVYGWDKDKLVLLPCSSWEYEKANTFTSLQSQKISAKDLIPGVSYKTKKEDNLIYVGRYMWYETDWYKKNGRKGKKCHIFYSEKKKYDWDSKGAGYFEIKNDVSFLAVKNSDEPVSDFAKIIDKFNKNPQSSDIAKCELVSGVFSDETIEVQHNGPGLKKYVYFGKEGDKIIEFNIESQNEYERSNSNIPNYNKYISKGYIVKRLRSFDEKTKEVEQFDNYYYASRATNNYSYYNSTVNGFKIYQIEDLKKFDFCDLYITLESGERIKLETLGQI